MSVAIAGVGWVTPLGTDIEEVWKLLLAGESPPADKVDDPFATHSYPAYRVPPATIKNLPAHPRLRRASAISRFAAAAGLAALKDGQATPNAEPGRGLALIFAVANGGVIYTKRFYADIVSAGASAASPLLFPETVFNAAASHLAAILGLTGATYTVVGDGTVGLTALSMGKDLIESGEVDDCLVVSAEEADWLLCDAYHRWRLLRGAPPLQLFCRPARGTILSEGAGAVLLSRRGDIELAAVTGGNHFRRRHEAPAILVDVLEQVGARVGNVISSANGTFIDAVEVSAMKKAMPGAQLYSPKISLGEGVAASALWQIIVGVMALKRGELPRFQYPSQDRSDRTERLTGMGEIAVLSCGMNQHAGAARLVAVS
jgi:3-oxoacyl-(acyl-carrier-protein) synthase